jgi:short-subunit dehydrogenase
MRKKLTSPKSILITGASSGIGAALSEYYAESGVCLFLSGRNEKRLLEVSEKCKSKGADVSTKLLDVTNKQSMEKWITECDKQHSLDLVIANAGISAGTGGYDHNEPDEQVREIFDINLIGVLNTVGPALKGMRKRNSGQIALMSSLASFGSWPSAPAYAAAKNAVRVYGESLRGSLINTNISINVVCPGFIKTPLTDKNNFKMPFIMDAKKAASLIANGLEKDKLRIAFPILMYIIAGLCGILPPWVFLKMGSTLPKKPAKN